MLFGDDLITFTHNIGGIFGRCAGFLGQKAVSLEGEVGEKLLENVWWDLDIPKAVDKVSSTPHSFAPRNVYGACNIIINWIIII